MNRPHSVLVDHSPITNPRTYGEFVNGYARGCLACQERYSEVPGPSADDRADEVDTADKEQNR